MFIVTYLLEIISDLDIHSKRNQFERHHKDVIKKLYNNILSNSEKWKTFPVNKYMFKVISRDSRKSCKLC